MVWRFIGQFILMVIFLLISESVIQSIQLLFPAEYRGSALPGGITNPVLTLCSLAGNGFALILSIWLAGLVFDRRPIKDFGFHFTNSWWTDFWFGISLGAILMLIIFLVEFSVGWITIKEIFVTRDSSLQFPIGFSVSLFLFILVGIYEELLSRGYQIKNLSEGLSGRLLGSRGAIGFAVLGSSLLFGLLHVFNQNASWLSTINIFFAGIFLATGYMLTGQLAIPIGLHISWNFFQGSVFGFPVSGEVISLASVFQIHQIGPALWTGGDFGPEGGLLGVLATFLGTVLILLWVKLRSGRIVLHLALCAPPFSRNSSHQDTAGSAVLAEQVVKKDSTFD